MFIFIKRRKLIKEQENVLIDEEKAEKRKKRQKLQKALKKKLENDKIGGLFFSN
jgi:hypothetical protein